MPDKTTGFYSMKKVTKRFKSLNECLNACSVTFHDDMCDNIGVKPEDQDQFGNSQYVKMTIEYEDFDLKNLPVPVVLTTQWYDGKIDWFKIASRAAFIVVSIAFVLMILFLTKSIAYEFRH